MYIVDEINPNSAEKSPIFYQTQVYRTLLSIGRVRCVLSLFLARWSLLYSVRACVRVRMCVRVRVCVCVCACVCVCPTFCV